MQVEGTVQFKIPKAACGQVLPEFRIKQGLQKLNPDILFDYATNHGKQHPYQAYRQGVYWDGRPEGRKHICSMDRGVLDGDVPEVPVWDTVSDLVEVHWDDVTAQELMHQEPPFPMPCLHDENKVQLKREVRNDIILVGWRHTFDKLVAAKIPGIDRKSLEREFTISMRDYVEPCEIPGETGDPWDGIGPEEGQVWDEMGQYEARPTVVLTDGD